jgi:hypothetical protein
MTEDQIKSLTQRLMAADIPSQDEGDHVYVSVFVADEGGMTAKREVVPAILLGKDGVRFVWETGDKQKSVPCVTTDMPYLQRSELLTLISPGQYHLDYIVLSRPPKREIKDAEE